MSDSLRPLDPLGSIRTKLGALVGVAVAVTAVLTTTATGLGVTPLITIPVAVLVALGLTQLLARGMTSPLREMTAAARVMATGDYSRRVTATSRDEVGELARAFNSMAGELAVVDQQRRDLVANVSHELRTPVSALHALLENVVDGVVPADREHLDVALRQSERLGRLVADLLDLSRVEAGINELERSDVDVAGLLEDAVGEARLAGHPVHYLTEVRPPDLHVTGDRNRLQQLLANLLDNAGRHSPSGAEVLVRAHQDSAAVVLEVDDQGPGIAAAARVRAFERFATSRPDDGGTGLGLAIARWVTDLHSGSIEVVDRPRGCLIRASLPLRTTTRSAP